MCKIILDYDCDCEGTPSYEGCTLIYKCKICDAIVEMGPWLNLDAPTSPICFHKCGGGFARYPEEMVGICELMGVVWKKEDEEKEV